MPVLGTLARLLSIRCICIDISFIMLSALSLCLCASCTSPCGPPCCLGSARGVKAAYRLLTPCGAGCRHLWHWPAEYILAVSAPSLLRVSLVQPLCPSWADQFALSELLVSVGASLSSCGFLFCPQSSPCQVGASACRRWCLCNLSGAQLRGWALWLDSRLAASRPGRIG